MSITMNAADARVKMSKVLNTAQHKSEVVVLTRWNIPAAGVVRLDVAELVDEIGMDLAAEILTKHVEGRSEGVGETAGELEVVRGVTVDLDALTDERIDRAIA